MARMDSWTDLNEILQNLVCAGVATLWLYLIYAGRPVPDFLNLAFTAVLISLGIRAHKKK